TSSVGGQYHREEYHNTTGFGVGIAPGSSSLAGAARDFSAGEVTQENATLGAFVQQQLAFNDRIFLTRALRGDDNSAFGSDIGFVWYPSVSGSWVIDEEPFFPELPLVSSLRLRSSWGRSGLRPSYHDALTYLSPVAVRLQGREVPGVAFGG